MPLRWIANKKPAPQAKWRCLAFPCAGGGAAYFRNWGTLFPEDIDFLPVQLPGRENRFAEKGFESLEALLPQLLQGLLPFLDRPFVFFGHSLGALIAFELARRLQSEKHPGLRHLFVAAFRGPQLPSEHPVLHTLADSEFIEAFVSLGGIPAEVRRHRELLELLASTAKKDFRLHETYRYAPGEKLACPITAWGGEQDPHVTQRMLQAWSEETSGDFHTQMLPGGHHFIQEHSALIIREFREHLSDVV